ncbi:MAG TPA: hypothetical protein DD670_06105, partial [Planctomycetaceae bacterium]|nr:hypothetical protein [Planctomycetaceae bacterium]
VLDRDPNPNPAYSVWAPRHFVLSPRDYAPLGPLFQTMREHPVPLVQEYGMWAQIWLARHFGGSGPLFDDFKKLIRSRIEHPKNDSADTARLHHYRTMLRALRHLPMEAGQRRHERLELANYMLDRGEMVGGVTPFESGNVIWEALSVQPNTREEAEQQAALIGRAKAVLDGKVKIIADWDNDKFVAGMRHFLEKQQQTMGATWPDLAPSPSEVPWKVARELVKCGGGERLLGPVLCDGSLLFVKSPNSIWGTEFEAFSASLDAMTVRSLGKATFNPERKPPRRCGITTTCAGGGYYFVSPIDDGIVAFSLTGGSLPRIGEAQGLPTNQVRAMAWLDGKLYAALAGGYLVCCDLTGQSCEILASSSRKQRLSPFDDSPPFSVPHMVADVKRHRLLFATHTPARPEGYQKTNGLWCYDPARKSFERLLEISPFAETSGSSTIVNDKVLLWHHVGWVLQVDLKTGKPSLLYSFNHRDQIVPGLNSAKTPYNNLPMVFGPYAEIDGWLWWVHGFGRMSKETNFTQTLPWPDGTQVHDTGFMYLEPLGDGESLVVGDESSFWLLTLKDASNP